jgi:membrane-associated phospholipid phosphatase
MVVDTIALTASQFQLDYVSWAYQNMSGNPVAAFPSLHAAYPVLAAFFLGSRHPRMRWPLWIYVAAVWFTIMYTGHHYLVDVIGGFVFGRFAWVLAQRYARQRGPVDM